jgi:hypothetical protein
MKTGYSHKRVGDQLDIINGERPKLNSSKSDTMGAITDGLL